VLTDVIAALATPPGRSALAVIRVSGTGAIETVQRLTRRELASLTDRSATLCTLSDTDGRILDQAVLTLYRAPHSYTGQDLVELSCHGGLLVPAQILAALHSAGARQAAPGEFTRRALLNGKLDLLQAEAVADLIDATVAAQGRAALHQLDGGLSRRINGLRETLLELLSLLAYDIDFPEEDDGPVPRERIQAQLGGAQGSIARLLATAPAGERLREGALVVLAGRPNAGKSSLFNALLGVERALVTEIPGTTRDTIEAWSETQGWPVRLADTAGLRDADERLEQLGIEVSRRYVVAADLLLLCVEAGCTLTTEEQRLIDERPALLVRSKVDLIPVTEREVESGIPVSVVTGEGLSGLRQAIADRLFSSERAFASLEPMLTRERHREALARAGRSLESAKLDLKDAVLAAHQVREAVAALEELIGVVHPDEVLGRVFERFCVGK
jgi:tRNA modification GTPase